MAWPSGIIVSLCKVLLDQANCGIYDQRAESQEIFRISHSFDADSASGKTLPLHFCILSESPTPTKFQVSSLSLYPSFTTDTSATHVPINMLSKQIEASKLRGNF